MKKILITALVTLCMTSFIYANDKILTYDGADHVYSGPDITLNINGEDLESLPMDPVILEDRTLVPIREVFEPMGAVVTWMEDSEEVYISYNSDLMILQVNNPIMRLNDTTVQLDSPPKIINDKLMVPIRAIAESMDFTVGWDEASYTVSVSSNEDELPIIDEPDGTEDIPIIDEPDDHYNNGDDIIIDVPDTDQDIDGDDMDTGANNNINHGDLISYENYPTTTIDNIYLPDGNNSSIRIVASSPISGVDTMVLSDDRLVIDIVNAVNKVDFNQTDLNYSDFSEIRIAQFEVKPEYKTRVVIQLENPENYSVSLSPDRKTLSVNFEIGEITNIGFETKGNQDIIQVTSTSTPTYNYYFTDNNQKLVIQLGGSHLDMEDDQFMVDGNFAQSLEIKNIDSLNSEIIITLRDSMPDVAFDRTNGLKITLMDSYINNIGYDALQDIIIINKNGYNIASNDITVDEDKIAFGYIDLIFNQDLSGLLGQGEYAINNDELSTINISTKDGKTTLRIGLNTYGVFNIWDDANNIYIKPMDPKDIYDKVLILDAGHGGKDPGTSGNGVKEKDVNLKVSNYLKEYIEENSDIKVYTTRTTDVYPELSQRVKMANDMGDMMVSIHNNSAGSATSPNGTETLYTAHSNDSQQNLTSYELANIIQDNIVNTVGSEDRGVKDRSGLVLLNQTTVPSVIVEIGFLSNGEEAAKLNSESYQKQLAYAIYISIEEAFLLY